jgi:hypothetical protein
VPVSLVLGYWKYDILCMKHGRIRECFIRAKLCLINDKNGGKEHCPLEHRKQERYKYIVCAMGNLRLFCTFLESSTSVLALRSALTYRRIVEHISWHVKAILCTGDACVGK